MKNQPKIFIAVLSILVAGGLSCSSSSDRANTAELIYWTAPSVEVSRFDRAIVEEWHASHANDPLKWGTIPAGTTSEEVILTSIATGTNPDICTNIFAGFAAQLADAEAIVALDTLPGFWEMAEKRKMTDNIKNNWLYKGHVYVLPIYISPEMMWYNKKMLDELGATAPPRTYGEFLELARKAFIPGKRYGLELDVSPIWWKRWFDYITLYCAASGGMNYLDVEREKAFLDNEAGLAVTEFFHRMFAEGLSPKFATSDGFAKEMFLAAIKDAGGTRIKELYPDLEYVIAPLLVPDFYPADQPVYTLAEQKGMVLFNNSIKKKQAWEFMQWYFTEEHDVLWLETTNYLPARDDLMTNAAFNDYFEQNPAMKIYAMATRHTVPLALTPQTVQIQTILNRELWQPIVYGTKTPAEAAHDANKTIERIMKSGQ
ncbi:extracellular solute-binding protein [candidate division KSB1 bacterium]|nr:extracellular solute-binding protein [candidate division KSB1 bacterium]